MRRCRLRVSAAGVLASLLTMAALVPAAGCGREGDVREALQVTEVVTGFYDVGIVEGRKNKLVPSISFQVKNGSGDSISSVQFNAVFRVVGDEEELGSAFVRGIDAGGLAPGGSVGPFVLRSSLGYTGEQPRAQMLQHKDFKDVQVEIFAKHGSRQWAKLGEYKIERQLLTQ
jgi:hypothetical protein